MIEAMFIVMFVTAVSLLVCLFKTNDKWRDEQLRRIAEREKYRMMWLELLRVREELATGLQSDSTDPEFVAGWNLATESALFKIEGVIQRARD